VCVCECVRARARRIVYTGCVFFRFHFYGGRLKFVRVLILRRYCGDHSNITLVVLATV